MGSKPVGSGRVLDRRLVPHGPEQWFPLKLTLAISPQTFPGKRTLGISRLVDLTLPATFISPD